MAKQIEFSEWEISLMDQLYLLTGRDKAQNPLEPPQQAGLKAIFPLIKSSSDRGLKTQAKCDLLNRVLITLAIRPMCQDFFHTIFGDVHLDRVDELKSAVERFRILSMLSFGNFRYGYRAFNENSVLLQERYESTYPPAELEQQRAEALRSRPEPAGLTEIQKDRLFALGYIAHERAPVITEARQKLKPILEDARKTGIDSWSTLLKVAEKRGVTDLMQLMDKAAIPDVEGLWGGPLFAKDRDFHALLSDIASHCQPIDDEAINDAQERGQENTATYLAMHDLDVYVATSMRDPVHFATNREFVRRLFKEGRLADYKLRFFDPTQSYLKDRIQKGLLECLMIKRARVTVYNAQESDTFGKDSELGVTLAQQKPAIVYVTRLFANEVTIKDIYTAIDATVRRTKADAIRLFIEKGLLGSTVAQKLIAPERTKGDVIRAVVKDAMQAKIKELPEEQILAELVHEGYSLEHISGDRVTYCVDRISRLEGRALTFRDVHPLSLQTSPLDGVARGVFVTRSVEQTAEVLHLLLRGAMRYRIVDEDANWLLFDEVTHSPVRVVTKNKVLTAAFWSEPWGVIDTSIADRFARVRQGSARAK